LGPEQRILSREGSEKGEEMAGAPRESSNDPALGISTLAERVRAFMARHELTRREMAAVLRTPNRTFNNWLDDGRTPPACLLALMDALETHSQVRTLLGVYRARKPTLPRGRPFKRGNPWRFIAPGVRAMDAKKRR
jgi:DNA-binding transcriptional regulator YiaG